MLAYWQEAFLASLRKTGNVSRAALAAGKDRSTVYYHRENNREFRRAMDGALKLHAESNVERAMAVAG